MDQVFPFLRPLSFEIGIQRYAEGSVLIRVGNTHVLCSASIEQRLPPWLAGKKSGWITAEYSMLPRATHTRSTREREKISGRTQEIQRLIGRALRSMVDLEKLGERSILVDCDVLQADGGTRTASVTGGSLALSLALYSLIQSGQVPKEAWRSTVAGISVGIKSGEILVDLNYEQDSSCDVDMNFVITSASQLVEVQGTAEKKPFSSSELQRMTDAAFAASAQIFERQNQALQQAGIQHPLNF